MTLAATILGIGWPQVTTVSAGFFRSTELDPGMILKVSGSALDARRTRNADARRIKLYASGNIVGTSPRAVKAWYAPPAPANLAPYRYSIMIRPLHMHPDRLFPVDRDT